VSPPDLPERVGPCRILGRLGAGGMGIVYLAEMAVDAGDARAGQRVALKVLRRDPEDRDAPVRFRREAEMGASLRHPAVVRTLAWGVETTASGEQPWLVLEHVEGRNLSQLTRDLGGVPEALLRDLAAQVARGLAAIHAAGIVHRDVKPSNLLITPEHEVRILDLGVARDLAVTSTLTATGAFVGTLRYAAPEQLAGDAIGAGADLYALGVVLFEAATGQPPFAAQAVAELVRAHLEREAPPIGLVDPRITPFFEEVVATLLAKDPAGRFPSAADLATTLEEGEASTWWADRETAMHARGGARVRRAHATRDAPLVGRDVELRALLDEARITSEGAARAVLLLGEAGIGKSRLAEEALEALPRGAWHVLAAPSETGLDAIGAALREHFGAARLESELMRRLPGQEDLARALAAIVLGRSPDAAPPARAATMQAWARVLRSLAAERPVALLVEDIHEDGIAPALAGLLRAVSDAPVLLVLTARTSLAASETLALEEAGPPRRIMLERLDTEVMLALARAILSSEENAARVAPRIAQRSDGHPAFAIEMLRALRARLAESGPDAPGALTRAMTALEAPSSVSSLLASRLEGLAEEDRQLLDVAAVQGATFDADLVARVLSRRRLDVLQALARLERQSELVRAEGAHFRFDHALLRDVLVGALPEALRREHHGLLASAEEARGRFAEADVETIRPETRLFLADHFLRGPEPASGLRYAFLALKHLVHAHRHEAVLELHALADAASPPGDAWSRARLATWRIHSLNAVGRRDEQRAAIDELTSLAERSGDATLSLDACMARAGYLRQVGETRAARVAFEDAVERARLIGDSYREANARQNLGVVLLEVGEGAGAREQWELAAVRFRKLGLRRELARLLGNLGASWNHVGRPREALESLDEAIAIARDIGDLIEEGSATGNRGQSMLLLGRMEEARSCWEQSLSISRLMGNRIGECLHLGNLALVDLESGNLARADERCRVQRGLAAEIHYRRAEMASLTNLSGVRLAEGKPEQALAAADEGLALVALQGDPRADSDLSQVRGEALRALERNDEALAAHEHSLEVRRRLDDEEGIALSLLAIGRLHAAAGRRDAAIAAFEEADALVARVHLADPGPLPAAWLAVLGARDASSVVVPESCVPRVRAEAHALLHRAGAGEEHRLAADEIFAQLLDRMEPATRDACLTRSTIARDVLATS
jgi:tetratricopeptide (TPR) repeat protein